MDEPATNRPSNNQCEKQGDVLQWIFVIFLGRPERGGAAAARIHRKPRSHEGPQGVNFSTAALDIRHWIYAANETQPRTAA